MHGCKASALKFLLCLSSHSEFPGLLPLLQWHWQPPHLSSSPTSGPLHRLLLLSESNSLRYLNVSLSITSFRSLPTCLIIEAFPRHGRVHFFFPLPFFLFLFIPYWHDCSLSVFHARTEVLWGQRFLFCVLLYLLYQ